MTTPTNPMEPFTPFLPSTFNVPEEEDRVRSFLGEKFSQISDVVNDKKIGAYTQSTVSQNGNKFSYDTTKKVRNGSQAMARVVAFPNAGVLVIPNPIPNVNQQLIISNVWGSASKPTTAVGAGDGDYFTFPNMGDPRISFTINDMNITITTTVDLSAYTGFIFLEFIPDGM